MKIQVSFDRTAKKEFRELCIQRLKNFVQQIKYNEASKNNSNRLIELEDDRSLKHKQKQRQKVTQFSANNEININREVVRESRTVKKQARVTAQNRKTALNEKESNSKQAEEAKGAKASKINFNMTQIKENISRIMQKFEQQHVDHYEKNKKLEQKLTNTNTKLDLLIQQLTRKKVIKPHQDTSQEQLQSQESSHEFELRFKDLQSKYNKIKQNSFNPSNYRLNPSKSIYSMQQTNDSVTFRRNY